MQDCGQNWYFDTLLNTVS